MSRVQPPVGGEDAGGRAGGVGRLDVVVDGEPAVAEVARRHRVRRVGAGGGEGGRGGEVDVVLQEAAVGRAVLGDLGRGTLGVLEPVDDAPADAAPLAVEVVERVVLLVDHDQVGVATGQLAPVVLGARRCDGRGHGRHECQTHGPGQQTDRGPGRLRVCHRNPFPRVGPPGPPCDQPFKTATDERPRRAERTRHLRRTGRRCRSRNRGEFSDRKVSHSVAAVRGTGGAGRRGPPQQKEPVVAEYLLYFNQQWVGDHSEEWFRGRAPLAMAVVDEMKAAGVYLFAGGLEEGGPVYGVDPTSGSVMVTDGPYAETKEFLGGFAVVEVADDEAAKLWAGKMAQACGWPHEVRRFG